MADYLVTGGAGFIGSHLVEELVRRGKSVRVLDNCFSGKWENLKHLISRVEIVEGDVRDPSVCHAVVKGVSFVSHQAGMGSVPRSIEDPIMTNDINVNGTLNLLNAAHKAGVKRFVFASSSSVYGDAPELPKRESMKPEPKSPYALSKLAAETYCRLFTELYGLPTVALRYFNVFGPRQDEAGQYAAVIPKFCLALARETIPVIFGDGEQTRDFCYVENVVNANLKAFESGPDAWGKTFNVACQKLMSLNQLLATLQEAVQTECSSLKVQQVRYEPVRQGDVKDSLADYSLARTHLGFEPHISVADGLKKTLAWYLRENFYDGSEVGRNPLRRNPAVRLIQNRSQTTSSH